MATRTKAELKADVEYWKKRALDCEATPAAPVPTVQKGIATAGGLQNELAANRARYFDLMKEAGATWVRIGLNYGYPGPGQTMCAEVHARGMKVLGCMLRYGSSVTPMEMAAFAGQVASDADAYEVWNEQNLVKAPWGHIPPEAYAGVYNAAKGALHSKRPGITVVSGGLSPGPNQEGDIDPSEYLTRALNAGMQPDAIGWHPYCAPALPGDLTKTWSTWYKMRKHPSWGKYPIWITEFGVGTRVFGEDLQAQSVTEVHKVAKADGITTPIFHYEGMDSAHPDNYGLVRADWTKRPAYNALKAVS